MVIDVEPAIPLPRQNACVDVTGEMRFWRFLLLSLFDNGEVTHASGVVCKQTITRNAGTLITEFCTFVSDSAICILSSSNWATVYDL